MAIVGITVSEKGEAIQRLAVTTKVAIGEVVKTQNGTRPNKLDHFIFLQKSPKTSTWESDPELSKHFGEECRDLGIILLNDEPENVFRTELAWWKATEKFCWGDGRCATRRTQENPYGEPWSGCGDSCPDLQAGKCKPSGDLYFVLADFPKLGSVCRLHTTSYKSIRQIHSALEQIRTITGGRMAGISCRLTVRPEAAVYMQGGVKKKTTIYALNIELSANGMKKLIGEMTQHADLFRQTRGLLTDGRTVEYVAAEEDEVAKASEITEEFNAPVEPEPAAAPMPQRKSVTNGNGTSMTMTTPVPGQPAAPVTEVLPPSGPLFPPAGVFITKDQRRNFFDVCNEAGWSPNQVKELLLEKWGVKNSAEMPADKYDEILGRFASGSMDDPAPAPYQPTDEDIPF